MMQWRIPILCRSDFGYPDPKSRLARRPTPPKPATHRSRAQFAPGLIICLGIQVMRTIVGGADPMEQVVHDVVLQPVADQPTDAG
jgi:hypothetical protein